MRRNENKKDEKEKNTVCNEFKKEEKFIFLQTEEKINALITSIQHGLDIYLTPPSHKTIHFYLTIIYLRQALSLPNHFIKQLFITKPNTYLRKPQTTIFTMVYPIQTRVKIHTNRNIYQKPQTNIFTMTYPIQQSKDNSFIQFKIHFNQG